MACGIRMLKIRAQNPCQNQPVARLSKNNLVCTSTTRVLHLQASKCKYCVQIENKARLLSFSLYYMYTSSRHRCLDCFGHHLLRCFDVFGSQIGSTESGNPVWTYENRYRPIWAPSYGSSIGRQRAWRTNTVVHVHESATL